MKSFPVPEAIDGRSWRVEQSRGASVDLRDRVMMIPLDNTPEALFLRAHEQGHAAITPAQSAAVVAKKHNVSHTALQVCEDSRVHAYLMRCGIPLHGGLSELEAARFAHGIRDNVRDVAAALVSSHSTGDYGRMMAALRVECAAADGMGEAVLETVAKYAAVVVRRVRQPPRGNARPTCVSSRGFVKSTVPAARMFDEYFGTPDSPGLVSRPESPGDPEEGVDKQFEKYDRRRDSKGETRWGDVDGIRAVPMESPRASKRWGKDRAWRDEGAAPVAVHRWPIDGRMFAQRRAAPGGTVLVDVSGSMSLSTDDVERIVSAAPAATVAVYAGHYSRGGIRIVARRGRVATADTLAATVRDLGGGNVVDGPALQWLAKQAEPRIWVSDGQVTGLGEEMSRELLVDAFQIVRRGGIQRVDCGKDAATAVAQYRPRRR
jgi:hypothetical protein